MKQIAIMGINYEILQLTPKGLMDTFEGTAHVESLKKLFGDQCQNFSGLCDAQCLKIYLNVDLPYEKKEKVFIHEVVEAMDQESCLELNHIQMQAIANTFFLSGIVNIKELLKNEPEDIEISLVGNPA